MRQPSGADFVEELARSARHYHAGLHLATQDIVEFLRSDYGESIVKQCDIRVLLGQTPEAADSLTRYFDLTPAERRALLHARPGEGLLFVGQQPCRLRGNRQPARVRHAHHPAGRPDPSRYERVTPPIPREAPRAAAAASAASGVLFVTFAILTGSVGVLAGDWGGMARPSLPEPAAAVADIPPDYLTLYQDAGRSHRPRLAGAGRRRSGRERPRPADRRLRAERGRRHRADAVPARHLRPGVGLGRAAADADVCDPADAIPAAAAYLRQLRRA